MIIQRENLPLDPEHEYWSNFKNLRKYIHTKLGGGVIRIEMVTPQYNAAIREAIAKFYEYEESQINFEKLSVDSNGEVVLPPHIEPHLIREVITSGFVTQFGAVNEDGVYMSLFLPGNQVNPIMSHLDVAQYIQWRQRLEDINHALNSQFSWDIIGGKINIYPKTIQHNTVGVFYGSILTPRQIESETWIVEYAVECAREQLGGILDKFSGFQSASGPAQTNGSNLIQKAERKKESLIADLLKRRPPLPIINEGMM